jgi:hypothetical protein
MSIVDFPSQGTIGTNLKPKRYDIEVYQGDTLKFDLILKQPNTTAVDVTGWVGVANIVKTTDNAAAETPELTLTVGGVDGKVTVKLSNTATAALTATTEYKYDIQLTDTDDNTRTYIGGKLTVTEDVEPV